MRFISGKFGSRKLIIPKHLPIRPTTDIAKEAVFNTLNNLVNFQELRVLDLFSGSGSLGLECISRGAGTTTFSEKNRKCIQVSQAKVNQNRVLGRQNEGLYIP